MLKHCHSQLLTLVPLVTGGPLHSHLLQCEHMPTQFLGGCFYPLLFFFVISKYSLRPVFSVLLRFSSHNNDDTSTGEKPVPRRERQREAPGHLQTRELALAMSFRLSSCTLPPCRAGCLLLPHLTPRAPALYLRPVSVRKGNFLTNLGGSATDAITYGALGFNCSFDRKIHTSPSLCKLP